MVDTLSTGERPQFGIETLPEMTLDIYYLSSHEAEGGIVLLAVGILQR